MKCPNADGESIICASMIALVERFEQSVLLWGLTLVDIRNGVELGLYRSLQYQCMSDTQLHRSNKRPITFSHVNVSFVTRMRAFRQQQQP